jgi:hypothetical protein
MIRLIPYLLPLLLLTVGCEDNSDQKRAPWERSGQAVQYHAFIWNNTLDKTGSAPLEALATIRNDSILHIESWDGRRKTTDTLFKPARIHWNSPMKDYGTFRIFQKRYTIELADE